MEVERRRKRRHGNGRLGRTPPRALPGAAVRRRDGRLAGVVHGAARIHVEAGEIVSIIGSNGAGKSTMLRTISGLLRSRTGEITFEGERYLFKLDYYDRACKFASPDPSNPTVTTRVLTIMHALDY